MTQENIKIETHKRRELKNLLMNFMHDQNNSTNNLESGSNYYSTYDWKFPRSQSKISNYSPER